MTRQLTATFAALLLLVGGVVVNLPATTSPEPRTAPAAASPEPAASPVAERDLADGSIGVPERLEIESVGVDARVVPVGTTPENAQEVPESLEETGWWRDGSEPGAPGNAVVVGHTASEDEGVFDPLVDVEKDDEVFVTGPDGTAAFTVTRTEVVPVADFADVAAEVYRAEGDSGLVLMTCGDWNGKEFETTVIVHAARA